MEENNKFWSGGPQVYHKNPAEYSNNPTSRPLANLICPYDDGIF